MDCVGKNPYITVKLLGSGYAAVQFRFYADGMWDVHDTGLGRYETYAEAEAEAKDWSVEEGIPFKEGHRE